MSRPFAKVKNFLRCSVRLTGKPGIGGDAFSVSTFCPQVLQPAGTSERKFPTFSVTLSWFLPQKLPGGPEFREGRSAVGCKSGAGEAAGAARGPGGRQQDGQMREARAHGTGQLL